MKTTISRKRIIIEQAQALTVSTGTSHPTGNQKVKKTSSPGRKMKVGHCPMLDYRLTVKT
ncbi:hypothetical protein [Bacteroides fragilis]|uniref:hypothetical protein n=1 Tax=Bacteroides fragilis TaxID=817 RepID=UPI001C7E1213|nr:hypothetical protein [Bacteroides fragilis]